MNKGGFQSWGNKNKRVEWAREERTEEVGFSDFRSSERRCMYGSFMRAGEAI